MYTPHIQQKLFAYLPDEYQSVTDDLEFSQADTPTAIERVRA